MDDEAEDDDDAHHSRSPNYCQHLPRSFHCFVEFHRFYSSPCSYKSRFCCCFVEVEEWHSGDIVFDVREH